MEISCLGKKAPCGLQETGVFLAPCDAGVVVGRARPGLSLAWEKNTVLSEMLACLAWLSGHLLTVGTLRTVWFVAELWFANVREQKLEIFTRPKP